MDIDTSYLVFGTGPSYIHCGIRCYIVFITLSRMIVLYSLYTVNRGYKYVCCLDLCNIILVLASTTFGLCAGRSPTCRPLYNKEIAKKKEDEIPH